MPESRIEWTILGLGLVLLGVLGVVIALNLVDESPSGANAAAAATTRETQPTVTVAPAAAPATVTATAAALPRPTPPAARPAPKPKPKPAPEPPRKTQRTEPSGVRLRLKATRGDSWLEVRAGSSAGTVLFSGTLTRGTTRTFRARRLWVRFGGASNLDASLNGRPLGLRFGTYQALVTARGLGPPSA